MAQFRPGVELVKEGRCPLRATMEEACSCCIYGHPLECHYPETCAELHCEQYAQNDGGRGEH